LMRPENFSLLYHLPLIGLLPLPLWELLSALRYQE